MGAFSAAIPLISSGSNQLEGNLAGFEAAGETEARLKVTERQEKLAAQQRIGAIKGKSEAVLASQRALLAARGIDPEAQGTAQTLASEVQRARSKDVRLANFASRNRLDTIGKEIKAARTQRAASGFASAFGSDPLTTRGFLGARGLFS